MIRLRRACRSRLTRALLLCVLLAIPTAAQAQTTGSIVGRVTDEGGAPLSGVTVLLQGPQGEQGTATADDGSYEFRALPLGRYAVHFYFGDVAREQPEVLVSVDKVVRVNARMPAAKVEEVKVVQKAPTSPVVDVGSSRVGVTFDQTTLRNVPNTLTMGGVLEKAPGAFSDPTASYNPASAGLSFAGTTGAENAYILDGVNMTAVNFGTLGFDLASPFIEELEVITGGYGAEYGHSMAGVVNVATKSGSNEWHGSASAHLTPRPLTGAPRRVYSWSTAFTSIERTQYRGNLAAEVGGPLIKDKLFIWVGYAPELARTRTIRYASRFVDGNGDGQADGANGVPVIEELDRGVYGGRLTNHQYSAKLTYRVAPDHNLSVGFYGIDGSNQYLRAANVEPRSGITLDEIRRQVLSARWVSKFLDRRLQIEANVGMHSEGTKSDSPYADIRALNRVTFFNSPSLVEFDRSFQGLCVDNPMTGFKSCPLTQYQSGGFGPTFDRQGLRLIAELKGSLLVRAGGWHHLKAGIGHQDNSYDSTRSYSGPAGGRAEIFVNDGYVPVPRFYRVLPGERVFQFDGTDEDADPDGDGRKKGDLLAPPRYQDVLRSKTKTFNTSAFVQDSYSVLPNLTFNVGMRWESQQLEDYQGGRPIHIHSLAPRLGVVYDPTNDGRAKAYGHYGMYYESIPMVLNDRAFGGEGIVVPVHIDPSSCTNPWGASWGSGDPASTWKTCAVPPNSFVFPTGGENLRVQKDIRGARSEEVVLGLQYQILDDLTVGAAYIRRWIGRAIEDTAGIVANPGDIPKTIVDEYEAKAKAAETAAAAPGATAADRQAAGEARYMADQTAQAASFPKPKRDYDALQLTATKRLARNWTVLASYTFSRTRGNYPGLYAADKGQLDPNYTSLYDTADLLMNRNGALPNDRPHILRVDGYYQYALGLNSAITAGLGAMVRSGRPNNTLGSHPVYLQSEAFILPRGSAGRTPTVLRFDLHLAYRVKLADKTTLDAFIDIFNLFNQQIALAQDQDYTLDPVEPIIGGDAKDLPYLKNINGAPVTKNPNYKAATAYQPPIAGRLGLRLSF